MCASTNQGRWIRAAFKHVHWKYLYYLWYSCRSTWKYGMDRTDSSRKIHERYIDFSWFVQFIQCMMDRSLSSVGDVTHVLSKLFYTLRLLKLKFRDVYYCPGNHELWTKEQKEDQTLGIDDSIAKFHHVWYLPWTSWPLKMDEMCVHLDLENVWGYWHSYHTRNPRRRCHYRTLVWMVGNPGH